MTRKQALTELIAKVETGSRGTGLNTVSVFGDNQTSMDAVDAFDGSLDAAKALHEAVLGEEWTWSVYDGDQASVAHGGNADDGEYFGCFSATPARAWLLSILRALHAQEGGEA